MGTPSLYIAQYLNDPLPHLHNLPVLIQISLRTNLYLACYNSINDNPFICFFVRVLFEVPAESLSIYVTKINEHLESERLGKNKSVFV